MRFRGQRLKRWPRLATGPVNKGEPFAYSPEGLNLPGDVGAKLATVVVTSAVLSNTRALHD